MSNRTYDILKIVALIVIPAIAFFIGTLGETWGWENVDKIVITINAVGTLLGSIITKISSDYYKKKMLKGDD